MRIRRLPRTLYSLFWSMFGLVSIDSVEIKYPSKDKNTTLSAKSATNSVEGRAC